MTIIISGPGVGLPAPQNLYPTQLYGAPPDAPTNYVTLAPGDALTIQAGRWWVNLGAYSVLQFQDPVTGIWRIINAERGQPIQVVSDGFTRRVANLLGCPVAAVVVDGGTNWVQDSTTVTPSAGNSTWQAIVGGMVSVTSVAAAGSGYGIAPIVMIAAPPSPGVQATAYATIANGTVAGVTITNAGAGYTSTPAVQIVPSPYDPNLGSISTASVALGTFGSGSIAAVLCTNPGAPLTSVAGLTLTASGAGSGASLTAVVLQTVQATSVVAGGVGLGTASQPALVTSVGGNVTATPEYTNPQIESLGFRPRPFAAAGVTNAGGTIVSLGTIYDRGMFANAATAVVAPGAGGQTSLTLASITFTMGTATDTIALQPL
jgi:hypothetical protein